MELNKLKIHEAALLLRNGDISAVELMQTHINAREQQNNLNAFITQIDKETLLTSAGKANDRITSLRLNNNLDQCSLLEGIPIANKDIYCSHNVRTTCGSKMLKDFVPIYESTVTQKLLDAGSISLGKLNMDEFAMGSSNENSAFGPCINPWSKQVNKDLVPGGSSGGSAVAVSAFMTMGATGSDTGGSVRLPASFTGLVGSRPTYGRCSRYGMIAFASSLDQAGILTRSVLDNAIMLQTIMGYDNKDSTSANIPVPDLIAATSSSVQGLRLGVPKTILNNPNLSEELKVLIDKYVTALAKSGMKIVEIELPNFDYGLALYYIIAQAEASSNLARYDGVRYGSRATEGVKNLEDLYTQTRGMNFGLEVKRRILSGTYILSANVMEAYYIKALRARDMLKNDFDAIFKKVDSIIMPTSTDVAFPIGSKQDIIKMYLNDIYTVPTSLAELPSISVPCGLSSKENLPLGLQIVSQKFDEKTMFKVGASLEKSCEINFNFNKQYN